VPTSPRSASPRPPGLVRQLSERIGGFPEMVRQISRGPRDSEFFCSICLNNVERKEQAKLCCEHEFCHKCVEEYVNLEIKEARVLDVHCPGYKPDGTPCDAPISPHDIKSIVDAKTFERYERFVMMKRDPNYVSCPKCNHLQHGNRRAPAMVCESKECAVQFCFVHSLAHPGETCKQYLGRNKKTFQESEEFVSKHTVKCPAMCCGAPITKSSGCNHMTCPRCNTNFCYLCGGRYLNGIHFARYNCVGCPNMQSTQSEANSRNTWAIKCWRCSCFPLLALLVIPVVFILALALTVQSCWLALFLLCCPCLSAYKLCLYAHGSSRADHSDLTAVACAGPILCYNVLEDMC